MVKALIIIVFFAVLYALKGGSGNIFPWWDKLRAKNKFTYRLLDGKVISTYGAFVFALMAGSEVISMNGGLYGVPEYALQFIPALVFALGWLLAVAPSMGEEHGAVGRIGHSWGPYVENKSMGRIYGIKKAVQRGVWMGACMAVATGFIPFLYTSLLFVPSVFIGQEITYRLTGKDGWALSEPIIGGLVFGLGVTLWL